MMKVKEMVKPSTIWPTAEDYIDQGMIRGLVRGYNVEIRTPNGETSWLSATFIPDTIEKYLNSEFMVWLFETHQWEFTGRVSFRGYGEEHYDPKERDTYVTIIGNFDKEACR